MERIYIKEAKKKNSEVKIAGWVHEVRDLGKLKFILLRDRTGIIQIILKKGLVNDKLLSLEFNREDVIEVVGEVKENKIAPDGKEIVPKEINILSKVEKKLPVDPTDNVPAELDTRLDFRYIDLRRKKVTAIFSIKSIIAQAFREKLQEKGFVEIHPTSIVAAATEGGTDVFELQYFENKAYLVQSPQLYKQLAVVGGFDKVYITTPVFRAEKHNTTTHLNEIIQMDIEMGFADDKKVMEILEDVFLHILKRVKEKGEEYLKILNRKIDVPEKVAWHTYTELIEKLQKEGFDIKWGEDFSREAEKRLDELLNEEAYFIYDWPTEARAFYSMPYKDKPEVCKAFDLVYKGLEIASGAQRIHIPSLLEEQLRKRGLDPINFKFYIDAFRVGAPPHAGWSIGLERITMQVVGEKNIRECMLFPRDRTRVHP